MTIANPTNDRTKMMALKVIFTFVIYSFSILHILAANSNVITPIQPLTQHLTDSAIVSPSFHDTNDETSFLQYTADGNLQDIIKPCTGDFRHHSWNQAGQLIMSVDNEKCGYYAYDGNGQRVYKNTGTTIINQYNAGQLQVHTRFNDVVLYVNPYFVVTPKGYTKHVYNGSQRICSEIGDITRLPDNIIDSTLNTNDTLNRISLNSISNYAITTLLPIQLQADNSTFADIDGEEYDELQWQCFDEPTDITFTSSGIRELLYPVLSRDTSHISNESAGKIYFCHTDHLGSATLITDIYGNAVQFMHYMPYGELFLNQQATHYNERFKFTGKERDTETGYDYFGARYYSSDLTTWLSPDPLLDKYPSISTYAYCENNPIKYVDPDGKEWTDIDGNIVKSHSNIKAYIFYNKKDFGEQTKIMYSNLEKQFGKGTIAISDATIVKDFQQDWKDMASPNIKEVNINHHGSNQAIHLDWEKQQYITSTGTGYTQSGLYEATNVSDLGTPTGNIKGARLNLNTCHSNNTGSLIGNIRINGGRILGTSGTLVGTKETLMQSFYNNFIFKSVRGTSAGVSYNQTTMQPEPQFFFQSWTIFTR